MSEPTVENVEGNICPQCEREQTEKRNFCPYCGYSFRNHLTEQTVIAPPTVADTPTSLSVEVNKRKPPMPRQPVVPSFPPPPVKFRFVDRRVLFGILGMLDIPVILVLLALLWGPRLLHPVPAASVCEQLDLTEFSPERYERGIGGELAEDTYFAANTEYLIQETLIVPQGRRLLVQSGARLVFDEGAALDVHGGLYVCGSERDPVTFTSDEGKPGGWTGIRFFDADGDSVLSHTLIQFAGDRAIYLENSSPKLLDARIANSSGFPISSDGNALPDLLGEVDLEDNPFQGIEIRSGKLDQETIVWPNKGVVYVVSGPVEVGENTVLSIEPGAVVKFWHAPQGDSPGIGVRGLLKAQDVQFTSVYDSREEVGGATYREAQDPQPGDWAGIGFYESSTKSYLQGCSLRYAGHRQTGAISMKASSPELSEVTITDGAWYPLVADADSFPLLDQLTLVDNDPGDAMEIRGDSTVTGRQERTWRVLGDRDNQIVRVIRGEVMVAPETTLIIEPGVIVKFEEDGRLRIQGTLQAIGGDEDAERIVFTSLRDGDYGGDTDKATGPQDTRSWNGVTFEQSDENSVLQNCIVRYASVSLSDASPRLINDLITESESAGIWASPAASPELRGVRLEQNGVDGVAIWKAQVTSDLTWSRLGEPDDQLVRVLAGEVRVAEGATISIESGAIFKFGSDGKLIVLGGLRALGEAALPVIFTSLNDDSVGGDTNRQLQEAGAGDWPGIEIGPQAHVHFGHAIVRYAQNGLALRGGIIPTIEGWLKVEEGKNALWCESEATIPAGFLAEGNQVNEIECPSQ